MESRNGVAKEFGSQANGSMTPVSAVDACVSAPLRRRMGQRAPYPSSLGVGCACRSEDEREREALLERFGVCTAYSGERLYTWDECPVALKYNKYIRSGYRAGMSYTQCVRSICEYHNETGNIHSHLLPLLSVLLGLASGLLQPWPLAHAQYFQNVIPTCVCLAGSVAYHTCMARHHHYRIWLLTDVCGVFVLFLGGARLLLTWGMPCYKGLADTFTVVYYTLGVLALLAALRARSAVTRGLPMLALFLTRILSFVARVVLRSGSQTAVLHFAAMEVWAIAGGVINAMRIPEKWFRPREDGERGRFDYWLNSHQIMHLFVLMAMLHSHWATYEDYKYWIATNGECRLSA